MSPSRVKVGFAAATAPPLRLVKMTVRTLRLARFDSLWTIDHFQSFFPRSLWNKDFAWIANPRRSPHEIYDYQVMLGYLAGMAGRLQLAVGVTEPVRRHPVLIAQAFLTLSHLVERPPILGIGSGEAENIVPYGLDFSRPVSRLEEALQIIRRCFDSDGPFDFDGRFYRLHDAVMDLRPAPGRTPEIWLAAHGPRMLKLAGRYGDGWFPVVPMTPDEYADKLAAIRRAAREAGRDPEHFTAGFSGRVVVAPSEREAREWLDHRSARFLALLVPDYVWRKYGVTHPLGEGFMGLVEFTPEGYAPDELEAAMAKVPVDLLAESAVWGTPEQVLTQLRSFVDAGMRHIVLQPISGLVSRRAGIFGLRTTLWLARKLKRGS
jgi:phthiodiolone/phenolphthiodiolone dimycocerosates ketoreductase